MTELSYYSRDGFPITRQQWEQLRLNDGYRLLRRLGRCCHTITAEWVGVGHPHAPKHVFEIRIDGGRFDGAVLRLGNEQVLHRVFDQTVQAVNEGRRPWWLQHIEAEETA